MINIICSVGNSIGGQVTKTNELIKYFRSKTVDMLVSNLNDYKKKPLKGIRKLICGLKGCDHIIIILSTRGYLLTLPLISLFCQKGTKIYEFVIGGIRNEIISRHPFMMRLAKRLTAIYVETDYMKEKYQAMGFKNVEVVPNFKSIKLIEQPLDSNRKELRICMMSRIDKYKGLDVAVEISKKLQLKKLQCEIDVFGPINDDSFFSKCSKDFSENIKYCGVISNTKVVDLLKQYDVYLFPSTWYAEGFPASIIDAMCAGNVILCNSLANLKKIIVNGENGWLIEENTVDSYVYYIEKLNKDRSLLSHMRNHSIEMAKQYDTDIVLDNIFGDLFSE